MYLVFDTETTGLPRSRNAPISDVNNWPRIIQIAWETFDSKDEKIENRSYLIRPDGFVIPADAQRVHGISTSIAKKHGVPIAEALDAFVQALSGCRILVGHNIGFDMDVLRAELYRIKKSNALSGKSQVCTMQASTDFCALPGRYGNKWPTLPELHLKLFGKRVRETHDAAADVATCSKCFFDLKRRGVVRIAKGRGA